MQFPNELARWGLLVAVLLAGVNVHGCSGQPITQTAFQRAAGDAASVTSAAAQTLHFVHSGRLTVEYGKAAMINFGEQLAGVPDQLMRLDGAPPIAEATGLAALVASAAADVNKPCLTPECDWQAQLARLDQAHAALVDVAE
jgi:hypothetical protein